MMKIFNLLFIEFLFEFKKMFILKYSKSQFYKINTHLKYYKHLKSEIQIINNVSNSLFLIAKKNIYNKKNEDLGNNRFI